MARRFRGESANKVDAKGRVSIPAGFRRVLEAGDPDWTEGLNPNMVIVYGDPRKKFLDCFTINAIEEVDQKIEALPRGSQQRKALEWLYSAGAMPCQIDDTGRIVLTQKLRDKTGITNEALFVATGDTFQIWEPSAHAAEQTRFEAWLDEQPDDFDPLTYLDTFDGA